MLIPKKTKYRYPHRLKYEGKAKGNKEVSWGQFGLKSQQGSYITNNQIEAARKAISKFAKKIGKIRINIFPHLAKTKKPLEVRMGSGKGSVESWVAVVKKGTIIFEVQGLPKDIAYKALKQASYKLPKSNSEEKDKYKIVERNEPN